MLNIDNIDPIKNFFTNEKIQEKVFSFLKKNNYQIINEEEYLDRSFDINITQGKPLPQIKNVGFLGIMSIKEVNSIQEKRTFKKLQKQMKEGGESNTQNPGMSKRLVEMLAKQEMIRQSLEELKGDMNNKTGLKRLKKQ